MISWKWHYLEARPNNAPFRCTWANPTHCSIVWGFAGNLIGFWIQNECIAPEYDWTRSVYAGSQELVLHDAPKPLGKQVSYSNDSGKCQFIAWPHLRQFSHRHSIFLEPDPNWQVFSKAAYSEHIYYGSEFVAAKLAVQQIINVQLMLCYLGVPMFGKTFLFGDNKSAKKSGSIPHSRLKKRHNALSYHFVREAANLIQFSHIPDDSNPADILGDTWMSGRCWNPFSFMKGTLPKSWKRMTGNLIRSLPRLRRRRCKDLILIQWIN